MNKNKVDILRLNDLNIDDDLNISPTIFELKKSIYSRKSPHESSPEITDCISSVRYLLEKSINKTFPFGTIKEIHFLISKEVEWRIIREVDISKVKVFDLLFFRNPKYNNNNIPTHMGICIGNGLLFQHGDIINKKILNIEEMYKKYNKISFNY